MKRNHDKHTDAGQAKRNILEHCAQYHTSSRAPAMKSQLGYAAFPDYQFKAPQGAAFSVAKLVRELEKDGLLHHSWTGHASGYYITAKGIAEVSA